MSKDRHHYVPRLYLRAFGSTPRQIHLYNLARRQAIANVSLRDQCYGHHLYGKTDEVEDALGELERHFGPLLKEIVNGSRLPEYRSDEYWLLIIFVALQMVRTKRAAESVDVGFDRLMKQALKGTSVGKDMDLDSVRIGSENPATFSLGLVPATTEAISDLRMHLICARADQIFITSDNPVFKYNQYVQGIKGMGVTGNLCRGLQLFLPLSPKHLLMLYDETVYSVGAQKSPTLTQDLPDADIATLNSLQIHSAAETVYFNDWAKAPYVAEIVGKSIGQKILDIVEVNEFVAEGDDRRSLISEHEPMPNLALRLSFVHIQKRAKRISFRGRLSTNYRWRRDPAELHSLPPPPPEPPGPRGPIKYVRRKRSSDQ